MVPKRALAFVLLLCLLLTTLPAAARGTAGVPAGPGAPAEMARPGNAPAAAAATGVERPAAAAWVAEPVLPAGVSPGWWSTVRSNLSTEGPMEPRLLPGPNPAWTATGEAGSGGFGGEVAAVGDVNGDGYADAVVVATGYLSNTGRVYLYPGSPAGLSATAAWTATGEFTGTYFGLSVAGTGDVNGDGYADLLIGAKGYMTDTGKAYLYLGSPAGPSASPDWTATGESTGTCFGQAVSGAGDVDGDGYGDVVVGALYYNGLQGKAYLYRGSAAGPSPAPDWTAVGELTDETFGAAVAGAGDVDGDGYADIAVGAHNYASTQGKVYLFHGSAAGPSLSPDWTAVGVGLTQFGISVAAAGDVNGDAYADLLVGAHGYNGYQGQAHLFLGAAVTMSTAPVWTATGEAPLDFFGGPLATVGDVNGDGYTDILVGAYGYSSAQGKAYLYLGSPAGPAGAPDWTATGEFVGNSFGSVAAGDMDGDGYSDLLVGAPGYNGSQGKAYLYRGVPATLAPTAGWLATGGSGFGDAVSVVGDVNGDGYTDIVVGDSVWSSNRGQIYLYLGSPAGPSTTPNWSAAGEADGDWFGVNGSIAGAGDVNGDGYGDMVVGAQHAVGGAGKAYLYLGAADPLSITLAWTDSGSTAGDYFGGSVAGVGDVNGDGYADILVGATHYSRFYLGSAAGPSPAADWWTDAGGMGVGGAGDVNGDGYADILVGDATYNNHQGQADLYLGSAAGPAWNPTWTTFGEVASSNYGARVTTAGDVNGDGYSDLLVGAADYMSSTGKVYLYLGAEGGPSTTPGWTVTGEAQYDWFGDPHSAGDVNGDGYADVLAGTPYYGNNQGKAYLYHGSASGPSPSPDWTAVGATFASFFGSSVSGAGDANGDGYADILVGAPFSGTPSAFLFYGNQGPVRPIRPAQWRTDGSAPIAPQGISDNSTQVELRLLGRNPAGRGPINLEWQVAPLGTPFTATEIYSGTGMTWTDPLTGSVPVRATVSGLTPGTPYHWRVRVLYHPNGPLGSTGSSWYTLPGGGLQEKAFRTADGPLASLAAAGDPLTVLGSTTHLTATADPAYVYLRYDWAFGDGQTGLGAVLTHTYTAAGSYTAVVTASNTINAVTASVSLVVEEAIAGLWAASSSPTLLGQPTALTATIAAGSNLACTWNLGDGSPPVSVTCPLPFVPASLTYTYAATGTYTVLVTATNLVSQATASTTVLVATDEAIVGLTAASNSPILEGWNAYLSAQVVAGTNVAYTWALGDGTMAGGAQVTHLYPGPGIYQAVVTATNSANQLTATTIVSVAVALPVTPGQGGWLYFSDTQGLTTSVEVPPGAVTRTVQLACFPLLTPTEALTPGVSFAGHAFILEVYGLQYQVYLPLVVRGLEGGARGAAELLSPRQPVVPAAPPAVVESFTFAKPVTVTVYYSDADVFGLDESSLRLVYWTGSTWEDVTQPCDPDSVYTRDLERNILSVPICHLSEVALIGD